MATQCLVLAEKEGALSKAVLLLTFSHEGLGAGYKNSKRIKQSVNISKHIF